MRIEQNLAGNILLYRKRLSITQQQMADIVGLKTYQSYRFHEKKLSVKTAVLLSNRLRFNLFSFSVLNEGETIYVSNKVVLIKRADASEIKVEYFFPVEGQAIISERAGNNLFPSPLLGMSRSDKIIKALVHRFARLESKITGRSAELCMQDIYEDALNF